MALLRTTFTRDDDGSCPQATGLVSFRPDLSPATPAHCQSGGPASSTPPTGYEPKWNHNFDVGCMASNNDSFASIAHEYDKSLTSEEGDASPSPETDDCEEIQIAGSDPEQYRLVPRQRPSGRSRSQSFPSGARQKCEPCKPVCEESGLNALNYQQEPFEHAARKYRAATEEQVELRPKQQCKSP